ncbi:GLPGLI family protein [Daejeonia sp. YH14]|uniref:GLPGLI family protein n=1 Tax=Daejeonia sp. YH14 TaxID=3439042 RepID=UPI003F498BF9
MKHFLSFIFFASSIQVYFSQNLSSDYVATYILKYKIEGSTLNEQFVLFMDVKNEKSYFLSSVNYAADTANVNAMTGSYNSNFNEKILIEKNRAVVFENVKGIKISYPENINLKWEITNQTKKFDIATVQLAKTTIYGRTWYAWFSRDIPVNAGPYKFKNLPGFIVSLYDEQGIFVFTLQQFKKKRKLIALPNQKRYKEIAKKDFNKTRYKIQTADDSIVIFNTPKEREEWMKGLRKRYSNIPLLDAQYAR